MRHDERRVVEERPDVVAAPAAADDLVAGRPRPLDEALDPREVLGVDERRDRRRVVARVAEHVLVGEAVEELEEALRDRFLDEQARPREADLAGVVVLAGRLPGRCLEVGVGEDEERPLAAELTGERHDVPRRRRADVHGGLGRARERDPAGGRMTRECRANFLADALDDVEDSGREAGLRDEVAEERARERRPFGGLQHDGRASRQRRCRLPCRQHERRVPRRDHDRRAARHPHDPVARAVRLPEPLLVRDGEVGVRAEVAGAAPDHARSQRAEEHRHVGALDGREALHVRVDQVGEPVHHLGPTGRAKRGPAGERVGRRRQRELRLALAAARHLRERPGVDRAKIGERRVAPHPLPADEVLGRDLDPGDLDAAHEDTSRRRRSRRRRRSPSRRP